MFFLVNMTRDIVMHPSTFGPNLHDEIKKKLNREVEGSVDGQFGFIVTVVSVEEVPQGKVMEGGHALFTLSFRAVVFKPFRNEVLEAKVTNVEPIGFWCKAGPLRIMVNKENAPDEYKFDGTSEPPRFVTEDQKHAITKDTEVRLRLVGVRLDARDIFAVGTIKDNYLGAIS